MRNLMQQSPKQLVKRPKRVALFVRPRPKPQRDVGRAMAVVGAHPARLAPNVLDQVVHAPSVGPQHRVGTTLQPQQQPVGGLDGAGVHSAGADALQGVDRTHLMLLRLKHVHGAAR
jgi:hypothetical protein